MDELLELKHRIEISADEIERIALAKVYDELLIDLWQADTITLAQLQSMTLSINSV